MTNSPGRRLAAGALLATLAVAFTGCAANDSSDSDSGGSGDFSSAEQPVPAARSVEDGNLATVDKPRPGVETRAVISTGSVSLRSDDVQTARDGVESIATAHGGQVDDERSTSDDDGVLRTTRLVLRIPSADFAAALDELKKVADLQTSNSNVNDVTTQVIDNDVRVRAQARSIKRIEQLLDRAQSIRVIMAIEGQLARRQATLDSLESQQAWLADQTSLATITVDINRTDVPVAKHHRDKGFAAGFSAGWDGLKATTVAVLTAAGALLPFAVVLAALALPVWLLTRRIRRRSGVDLGEPAPVEDQG
jgi:hypothetical protein